MSISDHHRVKRVQALIDIRYLLGVFNRNYLAVGPEFAIAANARVQI